LLVLLVGGCSKEEVKVSDNKARSSTSSIYVEEEGGGGGGGGGSEPPAPSTPPIYRYTTPCYYCPPSGVRPAGAGWQPTVTPPPGVDRHYSVRGTKNASVGVSYPTTPYSATISCSIPWVFIQQTTGRLVSYIRLY
jgi:hypothetical protein